MSRIIALFALSMFGALLSGLSMDEKHYGAAVFMGLLSLFFGIMAGAFAIIANIKKQ